MPSITLPPVTLVLGGARSGKSRLAERLVDAAPEALYLATATDDDEEMAARIAHHRARRGDRWTTLEEPLELAPALARHARPARPIVVDCLTLWLANLMAAGREIDREAAGLISTLETVAGPVVLVANEVGLGLVPENPLGRAFRDHAGCLNQAVAHTAQQVIFVAAGLPLILKSALEPTP